MNRQENGSAANAVVIIAAVIGALGVIAAAVVPGLLKDKDELSGNEAAKNVQVQKADNVVQVSEQGHNFNNIGGDVVLGISRKQYREDLNELERELVARYEKTLAELKATHDKNKQAELLHQKQIHEKALAKVREQKIDLEASYQHKMTYLQKQIDELNDYQHMFSDEVLTEAQQALAKGDESKAKAIYEQVIQIAKVMDKQAAKAEFALGEMARENIDYYAAHKHYQNAVKRDEGNAKYLLAAGFLAAELAFYGQAIAYYDAALMLEVKHKGEAAPEVARLWNNLGLVWGDKGELDKAIGYYEKALESFKRNLGDLHPTTLTVKRGLDLVKWLVVTKDE